MMIQRVPIRYFLIGLSAFILLAFSQQMTFGNIFQKGPSLTLAQDSDPNFQPTGSEPLNPSFPSDSNDPNFQPTGSEPLNPSSGGSSSGGGGSAPCPAQGCPGSNPSPAAPASCPESREQYPQCGGTTGLQNFPATDTIMVTRVKDCKGSTIRYESQNLGNLGQCQQATVPPPPAPAPQTPSQPAACFVGKSCTCSGASAGSCDQCSGGWCNGGQCSTCSAAPAAPATPQQPQQPTAPSCPQDGKTCPDGTVVTRNPGDGCNFFACPVPPVAPPAAPIGSVLPACNTLANNLVCGQKAYDSCTTFTQNGILYYNCVASQNANCTGIIECNPQATASTCTPTTTAVPSCVNAQLCTVNVTKNADCTTSRSGPFNCQNSAQCGFSAPAVGGNVAITNNNNPVNTNTNTITVNAPPTVVTAAVTPAHSFSNVGVGTTVYTQGVQYATTLPKTGLPLLAWAAGAFLPAGIGLRRFKGIKKELDGDGSFLWEEREYKRA